jgi:hypothetical protein
MTFKAQDYPALFCAADQASTSAQKASLRLSRLTLALLVLGAAFAAASGSVDSFKSGFAVASAASLALSLALSIYMKISKPEQIWYGGRAVAESTKSMAWRYMMAADPYFIDLGMENADMKFVSNLKSIVSERQQLAFGFGGEFSEQPQISGRMRDLRSASLEQRRGAYLTERISDQKYWYGRQAKLNRNQSAAYFSFITISQFLALLAALALITHPGSTLRLTGLFTSLASALIAWLQIKQHKEQAQSYSVAELELGFIQERGKYITNDRELSNFVGDAENAISREHTLWIARRDRA